MGGHSCLDAEKMNIEAYDDLGARCRMLGHAVPFSYCRQVADGLPCRLVLDCWHEKFAVAQFIQEHYTAEQIEVFMSPGKAKVASLVDLIEQAKRRNTSTD